MCFAKDLIDNVSFDNESINEDTELTFELIIKGFRIIWAKECIVYSNFPEEIRNLGRQRMRWTRGRLDTWRKNSFRILRLFFKEKNWSHIDLFFELLLPPPSFLIAINLFNIIVSGLIGNYLLFYISSIYILLIMSIYFSFSIKEGIGLRHVVALPFFLAWRNYISIISLFKKTVKW